MADEASRIFAKFDVNKDGKISETEFRQLLQSLGTETTDEEVKKMMSEMDKDGDGYVDLAEFTEFHVGTGGNVGTTKELLDAFSVFDKDCNGLICAKELFQVLKCLGEKSSLEDCEKMIQSVDVNGDGFVDFDEFKTMMSNGLRT